MQYHMDHVNFNVVDLDRSLAFYEEAFGMVELRREEAADGSYTLVFIGLPGEPFQIELTYLAEHTQPYELGENETHFALRTSDYQASLQKHLQMGCVCFQNEKMGLYFVEDPDHHWLEVLPPRS